MNRVYEYQREQRKMKGVACKKCGWKGTQGELKYGSVGVSTEWVCPKCSSYKLLWDDGLEAK